MLAMADARGVGGKRVVTFPSDISRYIGRRAAWSLTIECVAHSIPLGVASRVQQYHNGYARQPTP